MIEESTPPAADAAPVPDLPAEPPAEPSAEPSAEAPPQEAAPKPPEMSPAACGARLAELFPALFGAEAGPRPIKLRIQADLQQRAPGVFSKRILGLFLSRHTTTTAYLKALTTAPHRFDLDGQPAGEIAEEHRAAAVTELARRREMHEARRAAERAAARAAQPPRPPRPAAAPGAGGEAPARPDRPPRPPRPDRPPRAEGRPDRPARPPSPRPDRPRHAERDARPQHHEAPRHEPRAEAPVPREPQDPAQRERALLLRQFESSPLTKANFCVLKRISEAELDAQLALARADRQPVKQKP